MKPVVVYGREVGGSITGGYVYTGARVPALRGRYLYGDFLTGRLLAARLPDDRTKQADVKSLGKWPLLPSTFGQDADGEVYVAAFARGDVYRFVSGE